MSFDLTNKNIKDTFQNLLQRTGSDNRLYDLLGNEIGDLRISGSLIAQQYIVSSSVTNITTQQLSGSTQFGDSLDDTHLFTGSLNVTGSIAKGNIPFVLSNQTGSFITNIDSPSQGNIRKTDAVTGVSSNISLGLRTTDDVKFNHITASGEISASGRVTTLQVGKDSTDQIDFSTDNVIIFKTGNNNRLRLTTGALRPNAAGGIKLGTTGTPFGALHLQGDITASGNISASGNLFVDEITAGNTLSIGNITVLKKSFTTDNDGLNFKSGSTTMATFANSTGNFGIGTTTPTKKLQVTGDISASGTIFNSNITSIGNTGNISGFNTIAFQQAGDPTITLTANSVTIGDPDDANNETKLIVDDANKKVTTNVPLVVSSHITASGNISSSGTINATSYLLRGESAVTFDVVNSKGLLFSDTQIPKIEIGKGGPTKQTHIFGNITASGNVSSSGDVFANSGSFNYITASVIDVDGSTIRMGGESFTKANIQTLKQGRSLKPLRVGRARPDVEGDNGSFLGHITASGNISASGTILTQEFNLSGGGKNSLSFEGTSVFKGSDSNATIQIGVQNSIAKIQYGKLGTTQHVFNGNITASGDILNTQEVQMTNSSSVINTFDTGSHQTCKYVLQVTSGSFIQSSEMLLVQHGLTASNTEYAQINSGLNLIEFTSKINGSNVELIGSSSFISCSVKFNRTLI